MEFMEFMEERWERCLRVPAAAAFVPKRSLIKLRVDVGA